MTSEVTNSTRTELRRNLMRWLWRITLCVWLVGHIAIAESSWAAEAALLVIGIEIDGRAMDTVSEVLIIAPGQDRAQMHKLSKGAKIEQGAEIIVPRRTVLVLESTNGNQVRLQPGSRFKVNVVRSEGETYSLLLGQALFRVSRALNFFNVNYQSFLAIVRGTQFDMTVEPEKEIRFGLTEGRLVVQREVKVKILEDNKVAHLTASELLAQGGKTRVSYRLGVEEYLREFKTFKDAEDYFRRQLEGDEKSGEHERIQLGLNDLGHILHTVGKPRDAIGYFERALKAAQERQDKTWEAPLLNNLGVAYSDLCDYLRAIEYYEKALALDLKLYPDGVHPVIGASYNNLGNAYYGLGDYRTAIRYYEEALKIRLTLYPDEMHPDLATIYNNLGVVYRHLHQPSKAIEYYKKALTTQLTLYHDYRNSEIATSYNNLGDVCGDLGELPLAIGYYDMALKVRLQLYPDGTHAVVAATYTKMGNAFCKLDDYRTAIRYYEAALKIQLALHPDGVHPDVAMSYNDLGNAYGAGDDYRKPLVKVEGPFSSWFIKIRIHLPSPSPKALGEYRTAIGYYDKALAIRLILYPDGMNVDVLQTYRNLSYAWYLAGDETRWEEYDKKAGELATKLTPLK